MESFLPAFSRGPHTVKHSCALLLLGSVVGVLGQVAEPHLFGLWRAEANNKLW